MAKKFATHRLWFFVMHYLHRTWTIFDIGIGDLTRLLMKLLAISPTFLSLEQQWKQF
jgi:hypothetical protein